MSQPKVFAHVLLFNSVRTHGDVALTKTLSALLAQAGFTVGTDLLVTVRDNASDDDSYSIAQSVCSNACVRVVRNEFNLGFCAAQNQGVKEFLDSDADFFLMLTHDVALRPNGLGNLVRGLVAHPQAGSATPKLLRGDANLDAVEPAVLDASGMFITPTLRHFDRGSGELDSAQFAKGCYVFGGTGACLLLRRSCVEDLLLDTTKVDSSLHQIYPQLRNKPERAQLLDEAFFAYREDADLSWRGQLLGWRCVYVPDSVGVHKRVVMPERRSILPATLNLLGVRNRFLLQINNYCFSDCMSAALRGILIRNVIVLFAVLLKERSSLPAFSQVLMLRQRAFAVRRSIKKRRTVASSEMNRWFSDEPYVEKFIQP